MDKNHHNTYRMAAAKYSTNSVLSSGHWSEEEHETFVKLLLHFGKMWKRYIPYLPSRSLAQVRRHFEGLTYESRSEEYILSEFFG